MDKKAYVVGKDMEKGLMALLVKMDDSMDEVSVNEELERITKVLVDRLKSKGINNPKNNIKYIQLSEKIEIIKILFDKCGTVDAVERFIETVFDDNDRDGVKLMTIHKSKGLENDRVFFITHFEGKQLIPSGYAVTKEQLIQEKNLSFVATTRAKKELIYLKL